MLFSRVAFVRLAACSLALGVFALASLSDAGHRRSAKPDCCCPPPPCCGDVAGGDPELMTGEMIISETVEGPTLAPMAPDVPPMPPMPNM